MYELPPQETKKQRRPAYRKSSAIRELERLANAETRRLHPNIDAKFLAPRLYRDDSANWLTRCVIDYLRLQGFQAERINSQGRYIDNSKTFTDVTGRTRKIGSGTWIPTAGTKGTADISAVIHGQAVKIEVKMKDRQSEAQKAYQNQVEKAGGIYLIVKSFAEFKNWFDNL